MLVGVSALATILCVAIVACGLAYGRGLQLTFLLPLPLIFGCALFTVRGYAITPGTILIQRLFWVTRLPRAGLESAVFLPGAMKGSLRTWGNGGFYSLTGWYWSRQLGNYRAYVTSGALTLVLRYGKKTFVLSPGEPEAFLKEIGF